MATHGHMIKFVVQDGQRDTFVELIQPLMAQAEIEPGTLMYLLHASTEDPNILWLYERYVDEAAFQAHTGSLVHEQVVATLVDQVNPVAEMYWMELLGGKGVPTAG